jgi:hypothetical protein
MSRSNDLASIADEATGGITKSEVGLGNVDNTSDANKPVSTATTTALNLKAPIASPTFTGTFAARERWEYRKSCRFAETIHNGGQLSRARLNSSHHTKSFL